jgi:hypothetical protein
MNAQHHVSSLRAIVLGLLAAVALTACVPPAPPRPRPGIGTLLVAGPIRRDVTSRAPAGMVLGQAPPPGQRVRPGTPVDLVVSDRIR